MAEQVAASADRWWQRKPKNPDGTMTIVEHLKELRRRILICVGTVAVTSIIGFIWYQNSIFGLPSLAEIMRGPYCSLPEDRRVSFGPDEECRLLATRPFEMFALRLKMGIIAGVVLACPVWLYQMWAFITPGLHKNEKRMTFTFVTLAVLFFIAGALLAYFIMDVGLELLLGIGRDAQIAALSGQDYFNFFLLLIIIFGVSFEVPLILVMLNIAGVVRYDMLKDKRRYLIVALFIFAAVATPGQDPYSMLVMAISLCVLVEAALQFCRWNDKRRGRERPEWLDLDDAEASALDNEAGPVGAATPVSPAGPIAHPARVTPSSRSKTGRSGEPRWDDPGGVDYGDVL